MFSVSGWGCLCVKICVWEFVCVYIYIYVCVLYWLCGVVVVSLAQGQRSVQAPLRQFSI